MANTELGAALTEQHRRRQLGLRAATIRDIIRLWPLWNLSDPDSYNRFVEAVMVLTRARQRDSSALAARYYDLFRDAELPGGQVMTYGRAAAIVEPLSDAQLRASIGATARAGVYRALAAGMTYDQAMQQGLFQVSGSLSRHVLNGGRETILGNVARDPYYHGWARVTDGDPCAFCAMLASRGPVYKEETVKFQAHDHCTCTAEPVGGDQYTWPPHSQRFHEMWENVKTRAGREQLGIDPNIKAHVAFRQLLEGRVGTT